MKRALWLDWAWSLFADLGSKLAVTITVLVYYAALGPIQGSQILVAYSYAMVAWICIDLGLGLYGQRAVAQHDANVNRLHIEITFSRISLALPIACSLAFVLNYLVDISLLDASGFAIFLIARSLATEWRLRGEKKFKVLSHVTQLALIGQLTGLGAVFLLNLTHSFLSLPFIVWAFTMALLSWRVSGVRWFRLFGASFGSAFKHISGSFHLSLVNGVSTFVQQIPIIALSLIYPVESFAGFALLHRLTLSATMVYVSLGTAIFPRFVRTANLDAAQAWRDNLHLMMIIGLTCLPMILAIVLGLNTPIVQKMFFPAVGLDLILVMMTYLLMRSLRISPMRLLLASNQQGLAMRASILAAAFLVVLLIVCYLFDYFGVLYVALAFLAAEILMLGANIYLARGYFKVTA